jgi:hypothetical protein
MRRPWPTVGCCAKRKIKIYKRYTGNHSKWISYKYPKSYQMNAHKLKNLRFVVPCFFNHSNKTTNQIQQSIVKFIALSYKYCSTCFGITMSIIRSSSNCRCSLWFPYECGGGSVLSRPQVRTLRPPHSYGNQRLQRQFNGLLMMGIVMTETCWAVSVRQSNKFYDWLLHLVGCFIPTN